VGVFGIWADAKSVGAWLAGDGDFMGTIASKPAPTVRGVVGNWVDAKPVGARLAGDGDFMGSIASKPAPTDWGCFRDLG
jgi:hypothetical protein